MKIKFNSKYFRWGLTAFLVLASAILFYYFMFHGEKVQLVLSNVTSIVRPVLMGMAIAYLLTPILNYIETYILSRIIKGLKIKDSEKTKRVTRGIALLITAFLFVAVFYLLISMFISQIVPSVENIIDNFGIYTDNFTKWINQVMDDYPEVNSYVTKAVDNFSTEFEKWMEDLLPNSASIIKTVSLSVIGVFGFVWNFAIGFIISIYMLASKEKFSGQAKKIVYAIFEQENANHLISNIRFTHRTFIGFLSGKVVDSIIIGLLCFIGTTLMSTPYASLVSVIIGVTNIIPFFGPFLGAVPCSILILMVDPLHPLTVVYFIIFIFALQQFDGNILGPKILGGSTGLSGFWVIFSITVFGGLFGFVGMVVGIPIFAVIYAAIRTLVNTSLEKKELPIDGRVYEVLDHFDESGECVKLPVRAEEKKVTKTKRRRKKDECVNEIPDTESKQS